MKVITTIFFLMSFALSSFAGGPWTKEKNHAEFILNVSPVVYKSMSSSTGDGINLTRRVTEISSNLYVEYGIVKSLSVFGNLDFKSIRTSSKTFETDDFIGALPSDRIFGLGNSSLGLKYNFLNKKVLLSVSYATEFPATKSNALTGLRTGYNSYSFVPGLHFGQGFDKRVYYFIEGYFAARNNISHEWRMNAEVGYTFKKPLTLALKVNMKQSLDNRNTFDPSTYTFTGLYLNNQEFIAWSFNTIYKINEEWSFLSALAGGFKTHLIARTPVISAGVIWNFVPNSY